MAECVTHNSLSELIGLGMPGNHRPAGRALSCSVCFRLAAMATCTAPETADLGAWRKESVSGVFLHKAMQHTSQGQLAVLPRSSSPAQGLPQPPHSRPRKTPGPSQRQPSLAHIDRDSIQRARQASALVLVQQQVGDALGDREAAPGLRADQCALLQHHLQQRVVKRAQEVVVLQAGLIRLLGQPARACAGAAGALDTTASLLSMTAHAATHHATGLCRTTLMLVDTNCSVLEALASR